MNSLGKRQIFALLLSLFFIWGFITSLNDVLIPYLKALFKLNYTEAMLVQFCFFGAYFLMSIPAARLIQRLGYSRGIAAALSTMAVGCMLFIPASMLHSYAVFLVALFVLASGIAVLQVAANPFVIAVGPAATAASRLNLAQGVNSLAHTLAPLIGSALLLSATVGASAVRLPYLALAVGLLLIALVFFIKAPALTVNQNQDIDGGYESNGKWALAAATAIFFYVGIEVSLGGFIVSFLSDESVLGLPAADAGQYVSYYWGAAMVGRFIGYALLKRAAPRAVLAGAAAIAALLILVVMLAPGAMAAAALLAIGLFNSVMFPTIFSMATGPLAKGREKVAGLLITAIVGGAVVPVVQGAVADAFSLHHSFAVGLFCYAVVVGYAFWAVPCRRLVKLH